MKVYVESVQWHTLMKNKHQWVERFYYVLFDCFLMFLHWVSSLTRVNILTTNHLMNYSTIANMFYIGAYCNMLFFYLFYVSIRFLKVRE